MVCYGGRAIISTSPEMIPWCEEKLAKKDGAWLFEYPKLRTIDKKLQEFGHTIDDIHLYYLPNANVSEVKPITEVKWYQEEDILQFKDDDRFDEAFAFDENHPDVLGVAALEGGNIIGMAGASSDGKNMWQIGINVLPEYSNRGIATNLVSLLKNEILKQGKIPFYGTAISHINSQNVAFNSGFFPAWTELHSGTID